MPEGPEVSFLVWKLNTQFDNCYIREIEILSGRYKRHDNLIGYKSIIDDLPLKILSISNRGKYIWIKLENSWYAIITLGLTGSFTTHESDKHNHILFKLKCRKGNYKLFFNDLRNFGTIRFTQDYDIISRKLESLGPDPINEKVTWKMFKNQVNKFKNKKIGIALLDQKFISGIGNYLRAEVLYYSAINPHTKIEDIPEKQLRKLWKNIKQMMNVNYNLLKKGKHVNFAVYGKKHDPFGRTIIKEELGKRTIFYINN